MKFLETQHQVTHLSRLEALHLRAWLVFLAKEPSSRGKARTTRTCRWYAQSMHAFCNWLYAEEYNDGNPAERVELPKLEKPMIRIIEYDEFEKLLAACAALSCGCCGTPVSAWGSCATCACRTLIAARGR